MRLSYTLDKLKYYAIAFFMMASVLAYGSTGTTEPKKDENQKTQKEQADKPENNDQESQPIVKGPEEEPKEKKSSLSNVSFNYIFYLIYKIKYADIFKLPTRNNEDSRSSNWSGVSIELLYQKLTKPTI